MSQIKDIALAPSGEMKIKWVERNMPVLRGIGEDFARTRPFAGLKVALSVHLEAKTAFLCRVMEMGGVFCNVVTFGAGTLPTQAYYLYRCGLPRRHENWWLFAAS